MTGVAPTTGTITIGNETMFHSVVTRPVITSGVRSGLNMPQTSIIQGVTGILDSGIAGAAANQPFTEGQTAYTSQMFSPNMANPIGAWSAKASPGMLGTIVGTNLLESGRVPAGITTIPPPIQSALINDIVSSVGVVDADPFTPGVQTTPGIVTPTGPSSIVGKVGTSCWDDCPWWIWSLIGFLLLGALIGGLYECLKPGGILSRSRGEKLKVSDIEAG